MKRPRFVLMTAGLTTDQERAIVDWLAPNFGWFHHFTNSWLIVDFTGETTAEVLRDGLRQFIPGPVPFVVLQVEPKSWSGMMKTDDIGAKQTKWLNENWMP